VLNLSGKTGLLAAVIGVTTLTGTAVAVTSTPAAHSAHIHGCYSKHTGELRIVSSTKKCTASEHAISWNSKGTRGPRGVIGRAGKTGKTGLTGAAGPAGAAGSAGDPGASILNGIVPPIASQGNDGDFYLDTAIDVLYGPKASGAWPHSGTTLVGPDGDPGSPGSPGSPGPQGTPGPQGDRGPSDAYIATGGGGALPVIDTATVTVPAGSYVVNAKIRLSNGAGGSNVLCAIVTRPGPGETGDDLDESAPSLDPGEFLVVSMQGAVTLSSSSLLTIDCEVTGGSVPVGSDEGVLTAIQVGTLHTGS
jgi:hypothetical protein